MRTHMAARIAEYLGDDCCITLQNLSHMLEMPQEWVKNEIKGLWKKYLKLIGNIVVKR